MRAFRLTRYEVIAPKVRNDGEPSGYPEAFREELLAQGWDSWTEAETLGYWRGKAEAGTMFILYAGAGNEGFLGDIARHAMPDQEAIQVVTSPAVDLYEA